ncbi:MAG: hypothetical protein U1G05_16450 [Kiritimatiellia bacterium]
MSGLLDGGPVSLRFTVSGQQPDRIALRLDDPRDGTPVLVAAGRSAMLYDPVSSEVLVMNVRPSFTLRMDTPAPDSDEAKKDPDAHTLNFGFFLNSPDGKELKPTVIDIPSILAGAAPPLRAAPDGAGRYLLEGWSKRGNRLAARVEPARREGAFTRLELFDRETSPTEPVLLLDEILINPALPDDLFHLPEQALLDSKLPVRRLENTGGLRDMVSLGTMIRAVMFRVALAGRADEKIRSRLEALALKKLDWDAVERADRAAGQVLKSIFAAKPAAPPP